VFRRFLVFDCKIIIVVLDDILKIDIKINFGAQNLLFFVQTLFLRQ